MSGEWYKPQDERSDSWGSGARMLRFRPRDAHPVPGAMDDLMAVSAVIDAAMRPGCFFVAPELHVTWVTARAETIAWEIFRGRLVDASQTRQQKSFLSWHLIDAQANEPKISVKLDVHERQIHVTRGFAAYQWEGFDVGGGVIESREVVRWQRELVGTITLADFDDLESVRDELICLIWQAVVGTSRLPLTSVEAPLPAFTFGQLHYVNQPSAGAQPISSCEQLWLSGLRMALASRETVKLTEFMLHKLSLWELIQFGEKHGAQFLAMPTWRAMFNEVSLSPYTRFAENALHLAAIGAPLEDRIDLLTSLLNKLHRHLTAYDLITFHHRGANYPDALLLDVVLKRHIGCASWSEYFLGDAPAARRRRRAMRQGCLLRRHYEGLPVPDLPTSPGENARVLPASHPRVSDEQLTQSHRRRRLLFSDEPLCALLEKVGEGAINAEIRSDILAKCRAAIEKSVQDLERLEERVEMGMGLFIDRPLGYGKQVGEPDLTPLLAHKAFSPSIARRRWRELKALCDELAIPYDAATLDPLFEHGPWPAGLPHTEIADCTRPTAALADVRKVANDFVVLRTLPGGFSQIVDRLEPSLRKRCVNVRLCVQRKNGILTFFDQDLRPLLELVVDSSRGFRSRAGIEWPRAGLRLAKSSEPEA